MSKSKFYEGVLIDQQRTNHKTKCQICKKRIHKGEWRFIHRRKVYLPKKDIKVWTKEYSHFWCMVSFLFWMDKDQLKNFLKRSQRPDALAIKEYMKAKNLTLDKFIEEFETRKVFSKIGGENDHLF